MRKIIIITGASSGMGACFARQLAVENAEMWLIARRKERLDALACELTKYRSCPVKAICMDISGRKGVEEFASFLQSEIEREALEILYLVNNAGFGTYGTFAETPLEPQLDMIDTNCTALTGLCGVCLPHFAQGSTIINVASLASSAAKTDNSTHAAAYSTVSSIYSSNFALS